MTGVGIEHLGLVRCGGRGWMLASGQYAVLADAADARGVLVRITAREWRQAHELPGWYDAPAPVTPAAAWTTGDSEQDFRAASARLGPGPAVLRDYVKSMKHYWDQACYIPDTGDYAAAWKVAARFRELREDESAGGSSLATPVIPHQAPATGRHPWPAAKRRPTWS